MNKNTHNSMKNSSSTPILKISVGVHPINIDTKFEAYPWSSLGEVKKVKKRFTVMKTATNHDGHRLITIVRVTLTHLA